ncbi:MAG: DUF4945 domain-containing protein [Prevotella sp.]|jgi:hypothetical protein
MKYLKYFCMVLLTTLVASCYDRDVIDSKEFNHSMPAVENLQCTDQGNKVTLTWDIPDVIPDDIVRPISVDIQVVENNIYRQKITLDEDKNTTDIDIDADKEYHFIVKLVGVIKTENRLKGESDRVYSPGVIVSR